jgi:hypothetical protein
MVAGANSWYVVWNFIYLGCLPGNSLTDLQRGGGGTFAKTGGQKITLPGTNLNDVSDQASDLIVVCILNKIRAF